MQIKALFNNVAAWVKTKALQINYLQCFLAYPYPNGAPNEFIISILQQR